MKIRTWKLTGALVMALTGSHQLYAQFALPFSITQSSPALTFSINSNGTLLESGPLNSAVTFSFSGDPQMVWLPAFAAFRAGAFSGTGSSSTIGTDSTAFGVSTIASGSASVAMGESATASGEASVAMGQSTTANGANSMALGYNVTAGGDGSMAMGFLATAGGEDSIAVGRDTVTSQVGTVAMGLMTTASGFYSTAMGTGATANGTGSVAMGNNPVANADYSVAMGDSTIANGQSSLAAGVFTRAYSYASFAIGTYNTGSQEPGAPSVSATTSVPTDPAFEIGNGPGFWASSDAFVVYKNGDVAAHGTMRCAAGGDITMGAFMTGTAP